MPKISDLPEGVAFTGEEDVLIQQNGVTLRAPLDIVKGPMAPNLVAFKDLAGEADKLGYFTGAGEMDLANFSGFGRSLVDDADPAAGRGTLELGSAALLNADASGTLAANSDANVPTQKAVKTYVDTAVTSLLKVKGGTDCSGNPNYPAAATGDAYVVTVAGKIGGGAGLAVDIGDVYFATANNAGGTQAAVGASWRVLEHNLQGALLSANNLSDIASDVDARANLGLVIGDDVAPVDSPEFTGVPEGPTAASATSTPQLATTAFVQGALTAAPAARAMRLLRLAQHGGPPVAMAAPPAVAAISAASAITGTIIPHNSALGQAVFQYLGTVKTDSIGFLDLGAGAAALPKAGHQNWNAHAAGYRSGPLMEVYFSTDAATFEFVTLDIGNNYRIFVDELDGLGYRAVSLNPAAFPGSFAQRYLKITFGAAKPRNIRIELSGTSTYFGEIQLFGGIKIPDDYSIWKTPVDSFRAIHYGDSYGSQYGDSTFNVPKAMARQVGFRLGIQDFFVSDMPNDGYLSTGDLSGMTFRQRMASDIIAYDPDWIIVGPMGVNDRAQAAATLQAEVTTAYTQLVAALPNTPITVISANRGPGNNTSGAINTAIVAGVQAVPGYGTLLRVFDTFAEEWQSGAAGYIGATSGVGNSNIYIGADTGHPVQAGHDYLASRITDAVLRHAQSLIS